MINYSNTNEVAEYLQDSLYTIKYWLRTFHISGIKFITQWFLYSTAIFDYLDSKEKKNAKTFIGQK